MCGPPQLSVFRLLMILISFLVDVTLISKKNVAKFERLLLLKYMVKFF